MGRKIYLEVSDLHSQQLVLIYVEKTGFNTPFKNGARFFDIFRTNRCECEFDTSGHIFYLFRHDWPIKVTKWRLEYDFSNFQLCPNFVDAFLLYIERPHLGVDWFQKFTSFPVEIHWTIKNSMREELKRAFWSWALWGQKGGVCPAPGPPVGVGGSTPPHSWSR